jgi:four helix bundle protein
MPFTFEKLQVYQKAISFADSVCTLTRDLPRGYFFLADQLNRAALSIAANIAEGNGRFTKADRRNFFGIARGSVQECVPLLELASRQKLLQPECHQQLKTDLEEIARMRSGLINGVDKRRPPEAIEQVTSRSGEQVQGKIPR